jgi:hypothetical protein
VAIAPAEVQVSVVTDLLGQRASVSIWIRHPGARETSDGEMTLLVTGVIRAVFAGADGLAVVVQNERIHHGARKVGALSIFTVGPRGGVEVAPIVESEVLARYRAVQGKLAVARQKGAPQEPILEDMRKLWERMSEGEQGILANEAP